MIFRTILVVGNLKKRKNRKDPKRRVDGPRARKDGREGGPASKKKLWGAYRYVNNGTGRKRGWRGVANTVVRGEIDKVQRGRRRWLKSAISKTYM